MEVAALDASPPVVEGIPAPAPPPGDPQCLARLRDLGVVFSEAEPIEGDCPVDAPIEVTGFSGGLELSPEALMTCGSAEMLARWIEDVVLPKARGILGSAPTSVMQNSAYVCRNRYDDPDAKISEHAYANAIDIAAFGFEARALVAIGESAAGSPEARFENAVRAGACDYFTTVLGPGSNEAHATHFHFDMAHRRGGYRLCELGAPATARAPENTKRE